MTNSTNDNQALGGRHHCAPHLRKYVLAAAILASSLGFIDGSVTSIAIPQIRESLGASFAQAQWVSNAYMLFLAAFMLVGGAAADRYGIKRTFGFGILFFIIASQLCALAWSAQSLIAFRALQGAAAAIMVPGSMALIVKNFPKTERANALGIWVAVSSMTTAFGPLLGGFLLAWGGNEIWRWIFIINLPLGGLALALLWSRVPSDVPKSKTPLDWQGSVLATLCLAALATGLTFLGERHDQGLAAYLLIGGLLLGVLAIWWEKRNAHPMVDLTLFQSKAFSGANIITFALWMGLGAVFFYLPTVLVIAWGMSEVYAGGALFPFALTIAFVSSFVGRYVDRYGPKPFLVIGALASALAYLIIGYGLLSTDYWFGIIPGIMVMGISLGFSASPISTAVMASAGEENTGAASGINNMVSRMASLFGVAGLGALLSYIYTKTISQSSMDVLVQEKMLEAGFGERLTGALYQVTIAELQASAMNGALATVCFTLVVISLGAAIVSWMTQEGPN